jgi:hypothetical protein
MVDRSAYWGLALMTCATLMLQVILTRIFSVVMWYHMSLVAVSMAMFGMTVGSLIVHRRPAAFTPQRAWEACDRHSLYFGLAMAIGLVVCLNTPIEVRPTFMGLTLIAYWTGVAALPFVFSGVCVCVALTRFPSAVGRLYAADLAGAAAGCVLVVYLLDHLDAVSGVIAVAALAVLGAAFFTLPIGDAVRTRRRLIVAGALGFAALVNAVFQPVSLQYSVGRYIADRPLRHEWWNVFSYVTVSPPAYGRTYWGAGERAEWNPERIHLRVEMDTRASTAMVHFDGNWDDADWLMYDATSAAHHLRPDGPALVIGSGGGRDVLTALVPSRGARRVVGVDVNPRMVELLTVHEREFSGHLAAMPGVELYADEARSWLTRHAERFQVITIPLVDTSAASAAGAYALTENSLYTVEAFELFLDRLTDDGVLSVSRWWYQGRIGETHRLVVLAAAALRAQGLADPARHLMVIRGDDIATLLVSREPFSAGDVALAAAAAGRRGFEALLLPSADGAAPTGDARLLAAATDPQWPAQSAFSRLVDLSAPTDDRPYFFHSYRLGNLLRSEAALLADQQATGHGDAGVAYFDHNAMLVLAMLVGALTVLVAVVFWWPMRRGRAGVGDGGGRGRAFVMLGYFGAIGLGFMFFESAQMQRLSLFLGNPVYALTVVLFTLLLSCSLGAYLAGRWWERGGRRAVGPMAVVALLVVAAVGVATPHVTAALGAGESFTRILGAVALLAPPGILMGMFFPTGLRLAEGVAGASLAWCWGVNGLTSTYAAVLSIAVSISTGIASTYWLGVASYVVAAIMAIGLARGGAYARTAADGS